MTDRNFGAQSTTDEVLDGVDVSGRRLLVTGGTSGLGAETARAFAARGAEVVFTGRQMVKAEGVAGRIRTETGNDAVAVEELELGSLASIRACAGRLLDADRGFDLLINNAGVMACPYDTTADGFELQFGSNHLGHFLLTGLIAPLLTADGGGRVVALSSRAHHNAPVDFDDIGFERRPYDKWVSYGQSKTANVLFAVELDRRLKDQGVRAFSVHPGVIMTELSRHMTPEDLEMMRSRMSSRASGSSEQNKPESSSVPSWLKTVEAGAATQVYAATAPELEGDGGTYLEDCGIAERNDDPDGAFGVRSYALDPEAAARLWEVSEAMVGETFMF